MLGLPGCGTRKPCPLHNQWADARTRIHAMFSQVTLAELAQKVEAQDLRLGDVPLLDQD